MLQSETKAGKKAGPVCWSVPHIDHLNPPLSPSSVGSDNLFYQAEPLTRGGYTLSVRVSPLSNSHGSFWRGSQLSPPIFLGDLEGQQAKSAGTDCLSTAWDQGVGESPGSTQMA